MKACFGYSRRHLPSKKVVAGQAIGNIDALNDEKHRKKLEDIYNKREKKRQEENDDEDVPGNSTGQEELFTDGIPERMRPQFGFCNSYDCRKQSVQLGDVSTDSIGQRVSFNARLYHARAMSVDMLFIVFRQQIRTIQGVLEYGKYGHISEEFVRWSGHLQSESLVHVEGHLRKPPHPVTGCTIQEVEIAIENLYLLVPVDTSAGRDTEAVDKVQDEERMSHFASTGPSRNNAADRIVSLRTPAMQCIFRIKSGICNAFRSALDEQGFIEIHTPKLQPAATESGAEVFKLNYFGRMAFLAQSPQLSKQMALSADFLRVYEVTPVFRGKNSNTHRHIMEYIGLDLEMEIQRDYYKAIDIIDEIFKTIFEQVYKIYYKEIAIVKEKFPHDNLVWLEQTPRI